MSFRGAETHTDDILRGFHSPLQSEPVQFPYQTVMQKQRRLSMWLMQNMVRIGGGALVLFSLCRKYRSCRAVLVMEVELRRGLPRYGHPGTSFNFLYRSVAEDKRWVSRAGLYHHLFCLIDTKREIIVLTAVRSSSSVQVETSQFLMRLTTIMSSANQLMCLS